MEGDGAPPPRWQLRQPIKPKRERKDGNSGGEEKEIRAKCKQLGHGLSPNLPQPTSTTTAATAVNGSWAQNQRPE